MRSWILLLGLVLALSTLFTLARLPTPALFGGLAGALVYAVSRPRRPLRLPPSAFTVGQAIIGVAVGASVDWQSFSSLGWGWVLVAVVSCFSLVTSVLVGGLLLRYGVSRVTATFSTIAGGAGGLTAIADELGADARVVAAVQYLRLLTVLITMPLVATLVYGARGGHTSGTTYLAVDTLGRDLVFSVGAVALGLWGGQVLRLPTAAILGPLAVAAGFTLLPWFDGVTVPWLVNTVGLLCIGVQIGLTFTLAALRQIGRMIPMALVTTLVTILSCFALGWLLVAFTPVSPLDAYLATNPGGIYAVLGMSQASGGDVTFVAAAQTLRTLAILASAPALSAYLHRYGEGRAGA